MGLKLGVLGAGEYANAFLPLLKAHPLVDEVCLAELFPERRRETAAKLGIATTFESLEELCKSNVDAIAICTQRWMHGPQAVKALKAGKHVYSAVPTGIRLEELDELVRTVKSTGLSGGSSTGKASTSMTCPTGSTRPTREAVGPNGRGRRASRLCSTPRTR